MEVPAIYPRKTKLSVRPLFDANEQYKDGSNQDVSMLTPLVPVMHVL